MKYNAILLSASEDYDPSKYGFDSVNDALAHIKENLCKGCREDLERGYIECAECGNPANKDIMEIESPLDTMCGAEWCIEDEDENWIRADGSRVI